MDQVLQQNAAMVEQTAAATQTLNDDAGQLAGLVGQFQLPRTFARSNNERRPGMNPGLLHLCRAFASLCDHVRIAGQWSSPNNEMPHRIILSRPLAAVWVLARGLACKQRPLVIHRSRDGYDPEFMLQTHRPLKSELWSSAIIL